MELNSREIERAQSTYFLRNDHRFTSKFAEGQDFLPAYHAEISYIVTY